MPWGKLCRLVFVTLGGLVLLLTPVTFSQERGSYVPKLYYIYWNKTNPRFLISNNDHVIDVNDNDQIEIVCPRYDANTPEYLREYYTVYMVRKSEYNACTIYNRTEARLIVNCSNPTRDRIFTLYISSFGGIPNMPDFEPGHTYYFISTSTGRKGGLANQVEGACLHQGMKMMLRVCCGSTSSTKTSPSSRLTQPTNGNRPPTIRTTPRTSRRTTTRSTTTTTAVSRPTTTTTEKPKPPDYNTPDETIRDRGPDEKMPEVIDPKERNMGLINISISTWPQTNLLLISVLVLLCLIR